MIINVHHVRNTPPASSSLLLETRNRHFGKEIPITTFASVEEIPDTFFVTSERLPTFVVSIELPDHDHQDQATRIRFIEKIVAAVVHNFIQPDQQSFFKIIATRFATWCKNEGEVNVLQQMPEGSDSKSYSLFLKTNLKEMLDHFDNDRFPNAVIDIYASA